MEDIISQLPNLLLFGEDPVLMWANQLLLESWNILCESALFILTGFFIAGILHTLMGKGEWVKWLKGFGARSVILASAVGLPLPLCSCGVLPAAVSLKKRGASNGAVLSFLISTPETSVQSVLLTYSLLGPVMAIFRPVAAMVTALLTGLVENLLAASDTAEPDQGCSQALSCCGFSPEQEAEPRSEEATFAAGLQHAFVDIFDAVVGWLLLGIAVAAAIQVVVPDFVIEAAFGNPLQAMLLMLVIGVPLYVCAESSTPIAAALIAHGMSPGAALVFLLAGPATNIGAVGLLSRQLGRRTVVVYLAGIAVLSLAMGLTLDWFLSSRSISLSERALVEPFIPYWLKVAGACLLLLLSAISIWRANQIDRVLGVINRICPFSITRRSASVGLIVFLVLGYAGSGFFIIQPGQVGMVKRFGRVTRADVGPGLHYCFPYPVCEVDIISTRTVFRTELDYVQAEGDERTEEDTEYWVLLGDENIARITSAIHWRMKPGNTKEFAYGCNGRDRLVRNSVRGAIRTVFSNANIETALTVDQPMLAEMIHSEAQTLLNKCQCGLEIVSFNFRDLHAPPEVHEAFRDIASALEDKTTRKNVALASKAKIVPLARGSRDQLILGMRGYSYRTVSEATGNSERFLLRKQAYKEYPELTRMRLLLETYDRVFPMVRKCIKPGDDELYLDLRYNGSLQEQTKLLIDKMEQ